MIRDETAFLQYDLSRHILYISFNTKYKKMISRILITSGNM